MNNEIRTVGIKAGGYWVPDNIIKNSYFTQLSGIPEDWIISRTGIIERRKLSDDEATSDLAFKAARIALENAGMSPDELDFIILATSSPDMFFPSTACMVQNKLHATKAGAFDLSAACAGFVYGLQTGYSMVASGYYNNVMVIGAEALTRFVNWENKET
jgi:3-oxoacyl-[acyl-carrier-protein] synthase III